MGDCIGVEYVSWNIVQVKGRPMLAGFEYIYTSSLGTLVRGRV